MRSLASAPRCQAIPSRAASDMTRGIAITHPSAPVRFVRTSAMRLPTIMFDLVGFKRYAMIKVTPFRLRRIVVERGAFCARRIPALRPRFVDSFAADLRYLHDTLERTELNSHYWVWCGLLLGWAREDAILAHDSMDGDFAVDDRDFHLLVRSVPALAQAGFSPNRCFVNNDGVITELTFTRHGAHFDFFRMFPEGDEFHYFMYSIRWNKILEFEACVPKQAKAPFSFLGRTWLKQEDHERELQAMYGSWQIPDPTWSYLDTPDMVARRVSRHRHFDWPGGAGDLPAELFSPSSVGADEPDIPNLDDTGVRRG